MIFYANLLLINYQDILIFLKSAQELYSIQHKVALREGNTEDDNNGSVVFLLDIHGGRGRGETLLRPPPQRGQIFEDDVNSFPLSSYICFMMLAGQSYQCWRKARGLAQHGGPPGGE
jgi:hypothetical protein